MHLPDFICFCTKADQQKYAGHKCFESHEAIILLCEQKGIVKRSHISFTTAKQENNA